MAWAGTRTATVSSSRGRKLRHRASFRFRQHQRQWPRPERFRERGRHRVEPGNPARGSEIADMRDQGIERRPPLGLVQMGDRGRVGGVGAEPVDGLGRERHQAAFCEHAGRRRGRGWSGRQDPGFQAAFHCD